MKTPFRITEKTAAIAVGSTRTCDSRESLVQVGKVAGATVVSRWCDNGKSLVQLEKAAGATQGSRWCDFGAARGRTKKVSESPHTSKKLM